jgi:hypothetical protein
MPLYKYIANRFLTFIEDLFLGVKLSEYHTGFRAFTREAVETLPWRRIPMMLCSKTICLPRPSISASR